MAQHIEVISRGILKIGSHFLLCRSRKGEYAYLPGGHVEFGESARTALEREFLEESGLRVSAGDLIAASEASFKQKGQVRHEVNFVFHVELTRERKSLPEVDSLEPDIEFVWMTKEEVKAADVRPASAKELLLALGGRRALPSCEFASDFRRR